MGERVQAEVAPLEPALTQVPSLGKGYRLVVVDAHRQRVAIDEVLRQHVGGSSIEAVRLLEI